MNRMENKFRYDLMSTGISPILRERTNDSGYPTAFRRVGTSVRDSNFFLVNYFNEQIENIPINTFKIDTIDQSQRWYWTKSWQDAEKEADEAYISGAVETFDNMDDFISTL